MSKKPKIQAKANIPPPVKPPVKSTESKSFSFAFINPQNIFVLLAAVFGLCFVFTIPPFQVPDEASHMFRAYQLSTLNMKVEEQNNVFGNYSPPGHENIVRGTYLPTNFDSTQMLFAYLKFQTKNKTQKKAIMDACAIPLEPGKKKFTEMTAGGYFLFSYIPQIPAILLGRLLNLNVLPLFYLGRIFALFFFIFCVWYSIKIIPFGKNIFLALGLIPMSLSLAGSFSGDCVIISFSFLAVALSFYLMTQEEIHLKSKKLILLIFVVSLLGVFKPVYFPFVFLIFLLPPSAFKDYREYYLTVFITFFFSILFILGWRQINSMNQIHNPAFVVKEIIQNPSYQIHLILSNPFIVFDILQQTLAVKGEFYYKSLIGILGYLDTRLPQWIYKAYYLLLIAVAFLEFKNVYKLSIFQRVLILFISVGVFLATIFGMFVLDGVESQDRLVAEGVQGRYLIPALVAIFFTVYGILPFDKILVKLNKCVSIFILIICFVILYQTEISLYLRYFKQGNEYIKYIGG